MNEQESILIIDDDESTCRSLSLIFGKKGYETEAVGTGREALEKARGKLFNLALLDIRLPDVEGVTLLATLKEIHPDMVVIMATAYASLETAVQALNEGAAAYITKPLNMDEVLTAVQEALEKQRLVLENRRLYQEIQRELTERKRAEEEIRQRTAQLEALREVKLEITAHLNLDTLLHSIASRAVELLGGRAGGLYLYRQERDVLEWATVVGSSPVPVGSTLQRGEGLAGKAWETGEPLIVNDYQHWEGRATAYEELPNLAAVGVPVHWGGEFLGVLTVEDTPTRIFSPADADLLSLFATQAAIAIRNARLYEETNHRLAESRLVQEVMLATASTLDFNFALERTVKALHRALDIDYLGFLLPDEQDSQLVSHPSLVGLTTEHTLNIPIENSLVGQAYRTGQPVLVRDMMQKPVYLEQKPETRSALAVPVRVGDRIVAVLHAESPRVGAFGEDELRLFSTIAGQLSVTLENSRLFQAEREQRELAEALEEAAAAVSSTLHLDQVLDRILEQVERIVVGDAFNIMLIDNDTVRVVRRRGYEHLGVDDSTSHIAIPIASHPSLLNMIHTERPIVIPNTATDPDWVPREGREWRRSYIGAPIRVRDLTVGFLNVDGTRPGQFGPADARRLEAFANHAATAVEHAHLYQELLNHAEQLEQRVQERTTQLQAQYARHDAILRSATDGIIVTDAEGEILQTNPIAQTWLTQTLSPEDAAWLREAVRDLAQRAEERPETVLELTGLDLELKAAPVVEEETEDPTAAVVAIHDVSHLKAMDRVKSRFVSSVSHELRTPVTTIKLYAALMQNTPPEDEEWKKYLDALVGETDRQARLVEGILQISRIDTGRLEMKPCPTSLNQLTEETVVNHQVLAQGQGLTLEHRPMEPETLSSRRAVEPLVTLVDPVQMMRVLNNLVGNAIRYTPEGGKVVVSTGQEEAGGRTWATVAVADTGMGIPEQELPHIFERFFRGEKPRLMQMSGTGLGLAITKEIVELHGGQVTVESQVDVGTTFTVWLPLAR